MKNKLELDIGTSNEQGSSQGGERQVKSESKVPIIRFEGFTEGWEQYKASEIFETVSDKNHSMLPVLSASQELGMIRRDEIGIDIKYDEKSTNTYKRVKAGQFVIHLRSFQGGFAWCDVEGITSPAYTVLDFKRSDNNKPKFWKEVLRSRDFIKRLETVTYGIRDGRSISFADFSTLKFLVPSVEEQEKIGSFFTNLDNLISLHQRECDLLVKTKKSCLQKMFPKNNEDKPEIRFEGFTDAWEQCELGNIVEITMGQSPSSQNYTENPNDNILVQGNADMKNGQVVPRVWTTQITKQAKKGDLILSVRAPVGDIGKTSYDVVLGRGVASIRGNEFIYQTLVKMKQNGFWTSLSTGSTFESINSSDIKEAQIMIPNLEEQAKVGSFFANLDNLITLHQRKVEKLKNLKKTMLKKMFVSH